MRGNKPNNNKKPTSGNHRGRKFQQRAVRKIDWGRKAVAAQASYEERITPQGPDRPEAM